MSSQTARALLNAEPRILNELSSAFARREHPWQQHASSRDQERELLGIVRDLRRDTLPVLYAS